MGLKLYQDVMACFISLYVESVDFRDENFPSFE